MPKGGSGKGFSSWPNSPPTPQLSLYTLDILSLQLAIYTLLPMHLLGPGARAGTRPAQPLLPPSRRVYGKAVDDSRNGCQLAAPAGSHGKPCSATGFISKHAASRLPL